MRLLDLLRRVSPAGRESRSCAGRRRSVRPRMGLRVAGRSPHPLQPRVRAARRTAVERGEEARVVGRARGRMDRTRYAGFPSHEGAIVPRLPLTPSESGDRRRRAVHHACRRARLAVGADRAQGRAAAHALRAARVAGRERVVPQQTNPAADPARRPDNPWATSPDPDFPHVLTTYRLTEHHTAGGMSRTLSHLAELQPALFCEISPELAREAGIDHGAPHPDRHRARPHRGARARDAAHAAARRSRANRASDRAALALRSQGPGHGRRRQRS